MSKPLTFTVADNNHVYAITTATEVTRHTIYRALGEAEDHELLQGDEFNWVVENTSPLESCSTLTVEVDGRFFYAEHDPLLISNIADLKREWDEKGISVDIDGLDDHEWPIEDRCVFVFAEDPIKKQEVDIASLSQEQRDEWIDRALSRISDADLRDKARHAMVVEGTIKVSQSFREGYSDVDNSVEYIQSKDGISDAVKAEAIRRIQNPETDVERAFAGEVAKMEFDEAWPAWYADNHCHIDTIPETYHWDIEQELTNEIVTLREEHGLSIDDLGRGCVDADSRKERSEMSEKEHAKVYIRDMLSFMRGEKSTGACVEPLCYAFGDRGILTATCMQASEDVWHNREEVLSEFLKSIEVEMQERTPPTKEPSVQVGKPSLSTYSMER